MKILVTGGAGYLGSVLVGELLGAGHDVIVLDNFMYGQEPLGHWCLNPRFNVVRGDCRDAAVLGPLIERADVILPLAAIVGMPACAADEVGAHTTNLEAVKMILAYAGRSFLPKRIIIPITNSGYGIGEQGTVCTEESPLRPISIYGRTKVAAEHAVLIQGGVSLRFATLFGMSPRMRLDLLVNDFVHRAATDRAVTLFEARFKRNYLHVRDAARAFLHALNCYDQMAGQAYNVGLSDANLSKLELCERIKQHVPAFSFWEAPIGEDPDKRDYVVSNAKIEATGFDTRYSLDDGIMELLKGYRMLARSRHGNA